MTGSGIATGTARGVGKLAPRINGKSRHLSTSSTMTIPCSSERFSDENS